MKKGFKKLILCSISVLLLTSCKNTAITQTVASEIENLYNLPTAYEELQGVTELKWQKDNNGKLYPYSFSVTEDKRLYEYIYNKLYTREEQISITGYDIDKVLYEVRAMCLDNPDFYYVDLNNITIKDDILNITYLYTAEQCTAWQQSINNAVAVVKQNMPDNLTDYGKYVYLHDFVVMNVEYQENPYQNSVVGAFCHRLATCRGYSAAYFYLCREFELPCAPVTGYSDEYHLLNAMNIDGVWTPIDTTFDDMGNIAIHSYVGIKPDLRTLSETDNNYVKIPRLTTKLDFAEATNTLVIGRLTDRTKILTDIINYCKNKQEQGYTQAEVLIQDSIFGAYIEINIVNEDGELHNDFMSEINGTLEMNDEKSILLIQFR